MKLGKALATSAMTGMLAGLAGCGGGNNLPPAAPATATDVPEVGEKNCCKGRNACKGKSGCKTETSAACAGQNECKGKGTSCPRG